MPVVMQEQWRLHPTTTHEMLLLSRRRSVDQPSRHSHGSKQHEPVERESKLTRAGSSSTIMAVMADHDGAVSEPSVGPGSQRARVRLDRPKRAVSALDRIVMCSRFGWRRGFFDGSKWVS